MSLKVPVLSNEHIRGYCKLVVKLAYKMTPFSVGKFQEWDHTNFLVDLAGHYANCDQLRNSGQIRVDRLTPEGETITGFVDNTRGSGTDIDAVNGYIRSLVDRWTSARTYNAMVRRFLAVDIKVFTYLFFQ